MPLDLASLDPKVAEFIRPHLSDDGIVPNDKLLDVIGMTIAGYRDEAKTGRTSSGIEETWRLCEEAYAGIDDANRGKMNAMRWSKPPTLEGPVTTGSKNLTEDDKKSTLYTRLTTRYVDAAGAKLAEVLLGPGAQAFSLKETPLPQAVEAQDDTSPIRLDHVPGQPLAMRSLKPGEAPPPIVPVPSSPAGAGAVAPPGGVAALAPGGVAPAPLVPLTPKDLAEELIEDMRKKAKKAETRIYDWHVECNRSAQVRKIIHDSARLGVGVLKGPVAVETKSFAMVTGADGKPELKVFNKINPASKWVNPWNFFPDPACGEDIHAGDYVFERDFLSQRQVRALMNLKGYIRSKVMAVLAEGPNKVETRENTGNISADRLALMRASRYEVWYYYGSIAREDMDCICAAMDQPLSKELAADKTHLDVIVTMINDSVVRATINPLETGSFPYYAMPWSRSAGCWAGVGIAEQIATPQQILNASVRGMLNNAGISAGGQIIIDIDKVEPADGRMEMAPHKVWYASGEGGDPVDVREAFGLFEVNNVTPQLMSIIEWALRSGEESTSIPLITQGQSGPTTPDTYGAATLQNNNANQLLRDVGSRFDDYITIPETRAYYEYLLLDPDVPDDEKGDWKIDAKGSQALVERALQAQFIQGLGPLVLNPAYGFNPKLWAKVLVKAQKLDPAELQYTPEEQKRLDSQPPAKQPAIEAAEVRAAVDRERIAADKANADADNARADKELATQSTVELHTLALKERLAMLEYANQQKISLNQAKVDLARVTMTLQAQERMAAEDRAHDQRKHIDTLPVRKPPRRQRGGGGKITGGAGGRATPQVAPPAVEPNGRAPAGRAFEA